jgi:hypothetical protein
MKQIGGALDDWDLEEFEKTLLYFYTKIEIDSEQIILKKVNKELYMSNLVKNNIALFIFRDIVDCCGDVIAKNTQK